MHMQQDFYSLTPRKFFKMLEQHVKFNSHGEDKKKTSYVDGTEIGK